MGSLRSYNTYSEPSTPSRSESQPFIDLLDQCGIRALSDMFGLTPYGLLNKIIETDKSKYYKLCSVYRKGLNYKELIEVASLLSDDKPDMRYNYEKRVLVGHIFKESQLGLTALKFKDDNTSHWCAIKDGRIMDNEDCFKTIEEIKSEFKKFDWRDEFRLVFPLIMIILYAFLFKPVGFVILTPLLIFAIAYYFGFRKIVLLILVSLGFSVFLYLLFRVFLNVPIPLFPRGF